MSSAGTSKALAINVDDLDDDVKPAVPRRAPKKSSQTPKRPKVESIDLSVIADSDEDEVVFQKKNWKGRLPPPKKTKPPKSPAKERRGAGKKRAASYDSDSDYEQPPAKRVTRQSRAEAKGKAKADPEVYSLSESSDHSKVKTTHTNKKRPSLPQSSNSTATASSSTASAAASSHSQTLFPIFNPHAKAKSDLKSYLKGESHRPDDQPPPKKRPKLSKPSTSTISRMTPPPSSRAPTTVSHSAPRTAKPLAKRGILSAITREDEVSKVPVADHSSTSRPSLTGSPRNAVLAKVPPPGSSKPHVGAHGSSRDMPVQISDDDEPAECERSPSPAFDTLSDAWIYDLEGTEPAPPPRHRRSCSPIGRDERSPSPQIGPLQEECVYSLEGFQLDRYWARPQTPKVEQELHPDIKARDLRLAADTSHDRSCRSGPRWTQPDYGGLQSSRGAGASSQRLQRVDNRVGLLRARLGAPDVAVTTRLDILRRVRQPGGLGLGMRTSAHNRQGVAHAFPPRTGHSFAASGAVNDILQKNGWIAAGCSTSCQDDSEPVQGADNKHHTLAVFSALRNRWDGHDAHSRTLERKDEHGRDMAPIVRHYTVEGVAWDPMHDSRLVSCGVDGSVVLWEPRDDGQIGVVRRWDMQNRGKENRANTHYVYDSPSSDVTFPRDAPVFAVGPTRNGQAHIHAGPFEDVDDDQHVAILLRSARGLPGPLQWGHAETNNVLFAGMTSAYNAEGLELYTLPDIQGSDKMGIDAMDLDPLRGSTFAVAVNGGRHTKRYLHLYDVNALTSEWIARVELDVDQRRHRQVTAVSFSPDGVLLAVAHEDNSVYVFDTRFLDDTGGRTEQALFRYKHGPCAVAGEDSFGVTSIAWAPPSGPLSSGSGGYGLYSGGADGHVRLWRTGLSANDAHNGSIVASVDAGIGAFSLGDVFAGEKMLVVGDNNGKLAIWDRSLAPPEAR